MGVFKMCGKRIVTQFMEKVKKGEREGSFSKTVKRLRKEGRAIEFEFTDDEVDHKEQKILVTSANFNSFRHIIRMLFLARLEFHGARKIDLRDCVVALLNVTVHG